MKRHAHCNFFKDRIADAGLDLLDLLDRRSFVQAPDEEIDIARWSKLLMVVFSDMRVSEGCREKELTTCRWAFLDVLYLSGTGSSGVTTELPAATTFDQSRSTREDSEKRLKFFLKSWIVSTVAGAPAGFRSFAVKGMR